MKDLKDTIKKAQKDFGKLARFEVDKDKLVLRNTTSKALHPFLHNGFHVDHIRLGKSQIVQVNELIK